MGPSPATSGVPTAQPMSHSSTNGISLPPGSGRGKKMIVDANSEMGAKPELIACSMFASHALSAPSSAAARAETEGRAAVAARDVVDSTMCIKETDSHGILNTSAPDVTDS